jgi:hypothetical protein
LFVFLVIDDGWTSFTHLLHVSFVSAAVLVLACFGVCSLVVGYSTSAEQLDLLFLVLLLPDFFLPHNHGFG